MEVALRKRLTDAAYKAATGGLDQVTVANVARLAGVSRPTVYKYFTTGRPALLDAARVEAERCGDGRVVALFILSERD